MTQFTIATYRWWGEKWLKYYPEDLPEDWQLDYFCNDFRAVVVPISSLAENNSQILIAQWLDSVDSEFHFYFCVDTDALDQLKAVQMYLQDPRCTVLVGDENGHFKRLDKNSPIDIHWYQCDDDPVKLRDFIQPLIKEDQLAEQLIIIDTEKEPWVVAQKCEMLLSMMA